MTRRLLFIGIVAVGLLTCLVWFFAASILWATRDLIVGAGSPIAAERARLAVEVYAATAINVIALLIFLIRRKGFGWWVLAAVQVGDLFVSVTEAVVRERTWWLLSGLAALMLVLLYLVRPFGARAI